MTSSFRCVKMISDSKDDLTTMGSFRDVGSGTQVLAAALLIASAVAGIAIALKKKQSVAYKTTVLRNNGIEVQISNLGAIIRRLLVPDAKGRHVDIALGHASMEEYLCHHPFGMCRHQGPTLDLFVDDLQTELRVRNTLLEILSQNDGENHLHGGFKGWDKKVWEVREFDHEDGPAVKLSLSSPDGDEGYPGNVTAHVTYILQFNKSLRTIFEASTDKETAINIVQHCYFNLGGHESGKVLDHSLQVNATHYTPKDKNNAGVIPTGEIVPVSGTPFDFQNGKLIGKDFNKLEGGYDHNFVLFGNAEDVKDVQLNRAKQRPEFAALLHSPKTGIAMKVSTTAPGLQVYTGGFLSDVQGKDGVVYQSADGVCLETQGFPNAVNRPGFPSGLLPAGKNYYHEVIYQFSSS